MKNRWIRRTAMLLAVMLLSVSLAGIAFAEEELVTLKVYGKENSGLDWSEQYMTQYIRENLGINIEYTTFTNEQWDNQFALMLATDTLPDLFVGCNINDKAEIDKYGHEGFMLDFSQYLDYMPNFKYMEENYPMWAAYQKDSTGAIYGLSRIFPSRLGLTSAMTTFVKTSWLKAVGMEMPKTVDEFYEVLKAFKEQDANENGDPNDEIPASISNGSCYRLLWLLENAFGISNAPSGRLMMADADGVVYPSFTTENYRAYVKYVRKLYEEGLLDETSFVQTDDECREKNRTNQVGFFSDWSGIIVALGNPDLSVQTEYEPLVGLSSEYTDNEIWYMMGNCGYAGGCRTFASAKTQYPEAVAKLVDFSLGEEAALVNDYGVDGVTFSYVEDAFGNKIPSFTGYWEGKYATESEYQASLKLDEGFKMWRASVLDNVVESASDEMLEKMIYEDPTYTYTQQAVKEKALRSADKLINPFPDLSFTNEENAEIAPLKTDIATYKDMMFTAWVTGESDIDDDWDEYVSELNAMGLERLTEVYQASYDRMMK